MIDGLHFDFPSAEIKKHLEDRARYHGDRAAAYRTQFAQLGGQEDSPEDLGLSSSGRKDLAQRAQGHANKAQHFLILAAHVVPNEVYRLEKRELAEIELADHHY
jgi:hypothetical protein